MSASLSWDIIFSGVLIRLAVIVFLSRNVFTVKFIFVFVFISIPIPQLVLIPASTVTPLFLLPRSLIFVSTRIFLELLKLLLRQRWPVTAINIFCCRSSV